MELVERLLTEDEIKYCPIRHENIYLPIMTRNKPGNMTKNLSSTRTDGEIESFIGLTSLQLKQPRQ